MTNVPQELEICYFDCDCYYSPHRIRFMYCPEDGTVSIETHLNIYHNFFRRCWNALKYIFKRTTIHGHFDTWECCVPEKIDKMIYILTESSKRLKELEELRIK